MTSQTRKQRAEQVDNLVSEVKEFAYENYDNGWDSLVECHDDAEIRTAIGRARTLKGALKNVDEALGITLYAERRSDIESTIF